MGMGSLGGAEFFAAVGARWYRFKARVRGFGRKVREWGLFGPAIAVLLTVIVFAACCQGCAAGAVQAHAIAATTATVALTGARRIVVEEAEASISACDGAADRSTCLDRAETLARGRSAALDGARLVLIAWREAIEVAAIADDDGSLWCPLGLGLGRFVEEWGTLRALSERIPALPSGWVALVRDACTDGGDR
jgi:hypothetical protein